MFFQQAVKRTVFFPLYILFILTGCVSGRSISGSGQNPEIEEDPSIRLPPHVTPDMMDAAFWISRASDSSKVIMSAEQIDAWNKAAYITQTVPDNPDSTLLFDFDRYCNGIQGTLIRQYLPRYNPRYLWYTANGPVTEKDWDALQDMMRVDELQDINAVQPAVCVKRSFLRAIPSNAFYTNDLNDWYNDIAQVSGILMNEPILILWEDKSGDWVFVMTRFCAGWMHKKDTAVCRSYEELRRICEMQHFVTVTADRVQIGTDYAAEQTVPETSADEEYVPVFDTAFELFMGTRLELVSWSDPGLYHSFLPRLPYFSYAVRIPYRDENGYIGYTFAAVPAAFCCNGALPYTTENVLRLAFLSLGRRYGWGGQYYSRDCSEFSMEIYRCFGFILPRNSRGQAVMPGKTVLFSDMDEQQRKSALNKVSAGSILYMPGHIMVYLGTAADRYYVISAMGQYIFDSTQLGKQPVNAFSVSVNDLSLLRGNGKTWLNYLVAAKEMR